MSNVDLDNSILQVERKVQGQIQEIKRLRAVNARLVEALRYLAKDVRTAIASLGDPYAPMTRNADNLGLSLKRADAAIADAEKDAKSSPEVAPGP
jgi:hypothetical protein